MARALLLALLVAGWAAAAAAGTAGRGLVISAADCAALTEHRPDPSIEYVPGVDVRGRPVPPADLPGPQAFEIGPGAAAERPGPRAFEIGPGAAAERPGPQAFEIGPCAGAGQPGYQPFEIGPGAGAGRPGYQPFEIGPGAGVGRPGYQPFEIGPGAGAGRPGYQPFEIDPGAVAVDPRIPLTRYFDLPQSVVSILGQAEVKVGTVTVREGVAYLGERRLGDPAQAAIAEACAGFLGPLR